VQQVRWRAAFGEIWIDVQIGHARRKVLEAFAMLGRRRAETHASSLALLSRLNLIDARSGRVLVHPAIRESLADVPEQELAHHRAWALLASSNLSGRPGLQRLPPPAEWEELLHQMIGAKQSAMAWSFYQQRLGGFLELGLKRAEYARGDALLRAFGDGAALDPAERASLLNEHGLYLHRLGRLERAAEQFRRAAELASSLGRAWLAPTPSARQRRAR
jgi:hypothetical protein